MSSFVHLVVSTLLLIPTTGRVGISQVLQKLKPNNNKQRVEGRNRQTDLELQTLEAEVGTF